MKIQFIKYSERKGILCDKCGTYITNVWRIETEESILNIGCECFKKIESNLSSYGKEQLKKDANSLKRKQKEIELMENKKYERLSKTNQVAIKNYGDVCWLKTLKARYEREVEELNKKYKNINL